MPHRAMARTRWWVDILVLGALALGTGYVAYRTNHVLAYRWDWSRVLAFVVRTEDETGRLVPNVLAVAFLMTLRVAAWTLVLSTLIGTVFGILRTRRRLFARLLAGSYVELVRNSPPLVFIFIFYFFLSAQFMPLLGLDELVRSASPVVRDVIGVLFGDPGLLQNTLSGIACLALFSGAYVTEIVRAGLLAVPPGQIEAARTLGLSGVQTMRLIILPQALQRILPALGNQFVLCIKDSSLISLISVPELTYAASEVSVSTQRIFEVWLLVGFTYFVVCGSCTVALQSLERRLARPGRHP
jgi:polar amino acid transport system permease protein